jgi:cytochrome P450
MADGDVSMIDAARAEAYATPLDKIDPSLGERFRDDTIWPFFERLRREDPVHHTPESRFGAFWSITRYHDILEVDANAAVFSSAAGVAINDGGGPMAMPMFIAMDPPKHDAQRKVVSPIVSPGNLMSMEPIIRERAGRILDDLPIGETFDWVDRVSIELTTQMLATLFDFPFAERRKLTRWSNLFIRGNHDEAERADLREWAATFQRLWDERVDAPPASDLISMLTHGEATRHMPRAEYLGNVLLLIVGGNDTTRNSISGGLLALSRHPDQYEKLRADPSLVASMVPEIVRWQTPVAHMRRTATQDVEFHGKTIRRGDKVVMWYVSGNRDEAAVDDPDAFIIDRPRPRQHLSFGFGIHRCVGNRLAEMQLRVVWEETLKRFPVVEVVGEPVRAKSCLVREYSALPARIPRRL